MSLEQLVDNSITDKIQHIHITFISKIACK